MAKKTSSTLKSAPAKTSKTVGVRRQTDKLSAAHEKFCQSYALNPNGAEAYRKAFPKAKQSTNQNVAVMASQLKSQPKILQRISELSTRVSTVLDQKFDIRAESLLQLAAAIAHANPADYFEFGYEDKVVFDKKTMLPRLDANGQPMMYRDPFAYAKPSSALTRQQMLAVSTVRMTTSKTGEKAISVDLGDRLKAIGLILNHTKSDPAAQGITLNVVGQAQVVMGGQISEIASTPQEAMKAFEERRAARALAYQKSK